MRNHSSILRLSLIISAVDLYFVLFDFCVFLWSMSLQHWLELQKECLVTEAGNSSTFNFLLLPIEEKIEYAWVNDSENDSNWMTVRAEVKVMIINMGSDIREEMKRQDKLDSIDWW